MQSMHWQYDGGSLVCMPSCYYPKLRAQVSQSWDTMQVKGRWGGMCGRGWEVVKKKFARNSWRSEEGAKEAGQMMLEMEG